jgi:hypothetical protein
MAFKKGNKISNGRPKGSKNKDPLQLEERAEALGVDVFQILANFAAGNWKELGYDNSVYIKESSSGESTTLGYTITPEMRVKAATELMKYIYSQKKAVELSASGSGLKIEIVDYRSSADSATTKAK